MAEVAMGPGWELRCGRWQDVLAGVEGDALITDPPYSSRAHGAYKGMAEVGRNSIGYCHMGRHDIDKFVSRWNSVHGWMAVMSDHVLVPLWERAMGEGAKRYVFSPLSCVDPGSRVRLAGDGPSQWSVMLVVSRPRSRNYQRWGALPGAYVVPRGTGKGDRCKGVTGGRSLALMRAIVRDYSRPGDLIVDPCAGAGTTLLAAAIEGRCAIGAEMDPETFELAVKRLGKGYTPSMFASRHARDQGELGIG